MHSHEYKDHRVSSTFFKDNFKLRLKISRGSKTKLLSSLGLVILVATLPLN